MGKAKKSVLLDEKTVLSAEDVLSKVKRLDGYIKKTERRIKMHEKALTKLREQMKKEIKNAMQSVLRGKIYG